ncbi:MAG: tetratricopeptide repeat protein [Planctomycetota bacterium]|jgi:tetratricopeptide (TPR) repeat protein
MQRLLPLLLAVACTSLPRSSYVPGGEGLPDRARADYRRAVARERHGDLDGALVLLDDLSSRFPLRLGIHLHRLRLTLERRGVEEAAVLYDPPPPGVDPKRAAILVRLARVPADDVPERMAILESATALEPTNPFWRLAVAHVLLTAHDIVVERAEREHELGSVQASAESYVEAAQIVEEARQEAETALQYDDELKEAHLLLGFLWTRKADLAPDRESSDPPRLTAEYHYRQALALDPACLSGLLNLAENHIYFDRFKEALALLKAAAALAPKEPLAWNNLAYAYYAIGRLERAVAAYRKALQLDPDNARVRTALSDGLRRMDRPREALAELERARRDAVEDRELQADIAFKMAAIYEHEGRYREAVLEFQRHIDLGGPDAAKAESRIRHMYESAFE